MGGIMSKRTSDLSENLPPTAAHEDVTIHGDLNDINFRVALQSLPFNNVIEFTGLPLETNDEAAKIVIESRKRTWRDKNLSHAFQVYFNITSEMLDSLSATTRLVHEGDHKLKNILNDFISLEHKLLTHSAKIDPRMRIYEKLQVAVKTLVMVPLIGPMALTLIVGESVHPAVAAALVSLAFVTCGVSGRWIFSYYRRKKEELKTQESLIGLMLLSIAFQKKYLNLTLDLVNQRKMSMQDDVGSRSIHDFEKRLRNERKIILQKLSEDVSYAEENTLEELV